MAIQALAWEKRRQNCAILGSNRKGKVKAKAKAPKAPMTVLDRIKALEATMKAVANSVKTVEAGVNKLLPLVE